MPTFSPPDVPVDVAALTEDGDSATGERASEAHPAGHGGSPGAEPADGGPKLITLGSPSAPVCADGACYL